MKYRGWNKAIPVPVVSSESKNRYVLKDILSREGSGNNLRLNSWRVRGSVRQPEH